MKVTVGTIVKLKVACLGNPAETLGVGFNDYGDGCQVIFKNGEYDGFSFENTMPNGEKEADFFLEVAGFSNACADYKFQNVIQVSRDFDSGLFNEGLNI